VSTTEIDKSLPIDHLVVLARGLDRAIDDFEQRLGVRATLGGRHEAFGTHNALLSLGEDCYLELIAPEPDADPSQVTRRWPFIPPRPRNWPRLRNWPLNRPSHGPSHWPDAGNDRETASAEAPWRLVNFAIRSRDIARDVQRARSRGFDPGEVIAMSRERPDGTRLSWTLALRDEAACGGLVPFLIDWGNSPHPASSCPRGCRLIELRGEHPDPDAARRALAAVDCAMDVTAGPRPALIALIESPRGRIELR
jgi:hypothetical protein